MHAQVGRVGVAYATILTLVQVAGARLFASVRVLGGWRQGNASRCIKEPTAERRDARTALLGAPPGGSELPQGVGVYPTNLEVRGLPPQHEATEFPAARDTGSRRATLFSTSMCPSRWASTLTARSIRPRSLGEDLFAGHGCPRRLRMPGNSWGACGVGTSDQITLTHSQAANLFWATRPTLSSFALRQMTRCQSRPGCRH